MTEKTLVDRLKLARVGTFVLSGVYSPKEGFWQKGPYLELHGLDYFKQQSSSRQTLEEEVNRYLEGLSASSFNTEEELSKRVRQFLSKYFVRNFRKRPVMTVTIWLSS